MERTTNIPMPGDQLAPLGEMCTVIASIYTSPDMDLAMLLLLRPQPSFYDIVTVAWDVRSEQWIYVPPSLHRFGNIVPAVDHWQANGGDY